MPVYQLPPDPKKKRKTAISAPNPDSTKGHPIYKTPQWRALRARFIATHGERCGDPEHDNRYPREGKVELDHNVPLIDAPERALDPTNLTLRCLRCHRRKTHADAHDRGMREYYERLLREGRG